MVKPKDVHARNDHKYNDTTPPTRSLLCASVSSRNFVNQTNDCIYIFCKELKVKKVTYTKSVRGFNAFKKCLIGALSKCILTSIFIFIPSIRIHPFKIKQCEKEEKTIATAFK